ncbi:hypothetical protein DACRYDRAFT_98403 [Dacryopinax primogenitus]|uniref:TPR-like protein n=1 Tax=Dacryopinax primogenitus (strain DJM 731) TaxID=1858805 RepID=M5GAG5_DACPD|nr:uncharacterized protein DACRYDRAFT_98403 [Dacryopinax primogenitus]EJU05829.1 hypothetical protein DACRYDRAFT_98403 [Dacryopinax primogenitus]
MDVLLELALRSSISSFRMTYPTTIQLPAILPMVRAPRKPELFYGRDEVVEEVAASLGGEQAVHLAILGADGMGKTSVAAAVWHDKRVEARFGTRRAWICCEGLMSTEGLVPALAAAFNVPDKQDGPLRDHVLQSLRSRNHPALVVLDGFRPHSNTDVQSSSSVLAELADNPNISILFAVTGNERPTGITWLDPPLAPLTALDIPTSRAIYLAHGGQDGDRLNDLLVLLGGHPLALSLMAVLGKSCSPSDLAIACEEVNITCGQNLTGLELAVNLSLTSQAVRDHPEAAAVLDLLSLLPDGIELEEVSKALPNIPDCVAALHVLEQLGFVTQHGDRVRVPSSIRSYVRFRQPSDSHYLTALRKYVCSLLNPLQLSTPDASVLQPIIKESGNINSLLAIALRNDKLDADVIHAIHQLCLFSAHAHYGDFKPLVNLAVQQAKRRSTPDYAVIAALKLSCACALMVERQWNEAAPWIEDVEALDIPAPLRIARAILYAALHMTQHRFNEASKHLTQVLSEDAEPASLYTALCAELLAIVALKEGKLELAQSHCNEAESYYIATSNTIGCYRCQELIATVFVAHRQYADAFRILYELVHPYTTAGFNFARARVQRALYQMHCLEGRYEAALTGYAEAKRNAEKMHDKFAIADCERGSAKTYELMQQPAAALALYKVAIALFQSLNEIVECAYTRLALGHCMCDSGLPADGLSQMAAAMAAFDYFGLTYSSAKCKQYSGKVLASLKAINEGLSRVRAALQTFADLGRLEDAADCYILIGGICFPDRLDEAEEATKAAMELYDTVGRPESKANCTIILASCYKRKGMTEEMTRVAHEGLDILAGLDDQSQADQGIVRMLKGFLGHVEDSDDD